jgi:hypothetical protein
MEMLCIAVREWGSPPREASGPKASIANGLSDCEVQAVRHKEKHGKVFMHEHLRTPRRNEQVKRGGERENI